MILIKKENTISILEKSNCIRYLYARIEEVADIYLKKMQNTCIKNTDTYVPYLKHKNSPKSLWGYYAVSKPEKITIYSKQLSLGYLYNSFDIKKIISFFIVNPEKHRFINITIFVPETEWQDRCAFKKAFWDEIHDFFTNLYSNSLQKLIIPPVCVSDVSDVLEV